jgi:hypothetical protein
MTTTEEEDRKARDEAKAAGPKPAAPAALVFVGAVGIAYLTNGDSRATR